MKKLKIGDISKYYGLSLDSIRYYERIGLIDPKRLENNYREYSYDDLWKLNIIKELRLLNFPFSKIAQYLNNRTLSKTKSLFEEEISVIEDNIRNLKLLQDSLTRSLSIIKELDQKQIDDSVSVKTFDERRCLLLADTIQGIEQIDFYFRRLQLKSNDMIPLVGDKTLCIFMPAQMLENENNFYSNVCSFHPNAKEYDFILPKGNYLSVLYRGHHRQSRLYAKHLIEYAQKHNYTLTTESFEICHIDIHETELREEYVTEIQIGIN